jgi:hypothetical protein
MPNDTLIAIQNICDEIKITSNCQQTIIENINELWKKFPLLNNEGDMIECMICLHNITNSDNIIFECEHITHSSCFLNYLFLNLKNIKSNESSKENLLKLFRCPKCRNYVTEKIKSFSSNNAERQNENNITNITNSTNSTDSDEDEHYIIDEEYIIDEQYGDEYNNFIFQEFNLIENSMDNLMLNDMFRVSNDIIMNNLGSNIIINNDEQTNFNFSSYDTDDDESINSNTHIIDSD